MRTPRTDIAASVLAQMQPWADAPFEGPRAPADGLTGLQYLRQNMTPLKIALAKAEWDAMDWRGNLPEDWPERRAQLLKEWNDG